jgi:hypothetical protein
MCESVCARARERQRVRLHSCGRAVRRDLFVPFLARAVWRHRLLPGVSGRQRRAAERAVEPLTHMRVPNNGRTLAIHQGNPRTLAISSVGGMALSGRSWAGAAAGRGRACREKADPPALASRPRLKVIKKTLKHTPFEWARLVVPMSCQGKIDIIASSNFYGTSMCHGCEHRCNANKFENINFVQNNVSIHQITYLGL